MVERESWKLVNEGNLARTWERRLKPRPHPKPIKRIRPWVRTAIWIGTMWLSAGMATLLAVHVMVMGYQVDALKQQYVGLTRQNQEIRLAVSERTSAAAVAQDAAKYHMTLVMPPATVSPRRIKTPARFHEVKWAQKVSWFINQMRGAAIGQ